MYTGSQASKDIRRIQALIDETEANNPGNTDRLKRLYRKRRVLIHFVRRTSPKMSRVVDTPNQRRTA